MIILLSPINLEVKDLTCLLRNLYSGQEATLKTRHGTMLSRFSHVQLFAALWTRSPPGSSVHGVLHARILEWVAMPFSQPRDGACLLCLLHGQASSLPLASPISSVQFCHKSCPTLCDPMDCSMPGFPVHHQLPKLAQIHVH